ncbi:hypothetical protein FB45DRAFT_1025305 [Roridomyces roridus]|uniref:Uncharacterized protein n=1 Tax=Roridomyces roridus TaxID=1738132 RepID=A0AAD7FRU4_9AGAR|nr:hypothetical protein FB45DRAFT_1025305 [Roridomyces roridus]
MDIDSDSERPQPKKTRKSAPTAFVGPTTLPLVDRARSRSKAPASASGSATSRSTSASSDGSRRHPLARDLSAELARDFPTDDALHAAISEFDRRHLKPIAPPTQRKHDHSKGLWIEYFAHLYKDKEKAKKTLESQAPFPPLEEVKMFIYFCATRGSSRLGIPGINHHGPVSEYYRRVYALTIEHGATPETPEQRKQLYAALAT